jgi:1-aminocyclopropane-1-carboxylate deaminase/D-cysteine desulfhydrase-like pyridoxal-dependent ACC family enzyme
MNQLWPLFDRFPRLGDLPRAHLRQAVTPVLPLHEIHPRLWIKRDDLTATPIGGNKIRALEFLLGGLIAGDRILTAGSSGSTHALTTAIHARSLGVTTTVASWPQEMNDVAARVARRLDGEADRRMFANPVFAAMWLTLRAWRGDRVIPAGGTAPLGILGHVNAAMELAGQVRAGLLPIPGKVVVPLGTGGTAAGLALGFWLAGLETTVYAARVVPAIIGRERRVLALGRKTNRLIARLTGQTLKDPELDVVVDHNVYGGAYGRPLPAAERIAERLPAGLRVDPTYSAKALVTAEACARHVDTLFWLTFDSRWMNP